MHPYGDGYGQGTKKASQQNPYAVTTPYVTYPYGMSSFASRPPTTQSINSDSTPSNPKALTSGQRPTYWTQSSQNTTNPIPTTNWSSPSSPTPATGYPSIYPSMSTAYGAPEVQQQTYPNSYSQPTSTSYGPYSTTTHPQTQGINFGKDGLFSHFPKSNQSHWACENCKRFRSEDIGRPMYCFHCQASTNTVRYSPRG